MGAAETTPPRSITSEGLSSRAVGACWVVAVILMAAGITATFVAGTGAAPASMILFGSLFLVLALMRRVPLSLEVGGAKIDASYQVNEAFDAGRGIGLQQGVEVALNDVEKAEETGEPAHVALERRRDSWARDAWIEVVEGAAAGEQGRLWPSGEIGYRGPAACSAGGITHRQLDYWTRTGMVTPHGGADLWTERDIVLVKMIRRLLDAGISLQQIRTAVAHLVDRAPELLDRVTLISDGASVYEATSDDEVLELLQSGRAMFGISMAGVVREVRSALRDLPGESIGPKLG